MDKSLVTLERMRSFVRVAERGNLSAVAKELCVGQSTVTRHLTELESSLGVRLLSRTTRTVTLTEEGRSYLSNAIRILDLVEQAGDEVRIDGMSATGTVRISASFAFGVAHLSRLLFAFQDRHPAIELDIGLTDERIDLVREDKDLAIRMGPLIDSSLKVRHLGMSQFSLMASRAYLERQSRPRKPEDLRVHRAIRKANTPFNSELVLNGPDGRRHVAIFDGPFRVDNGLVAREALLAGRGIAVMPHWLVADLLTSGQLEILLPEYDIPSSPVSLVLVPERATVARVRIIADFLAQEIGSLLHEHRSSGRT